MPKYYETYEYIWIDGDGNLRSKTRVFYDGENTKNLPEWSFDGSSTKQAEGHDSDVFIRPRFICADPFSQYHNTKSFLVLCDTYDKNGKPHVTNKRVDCVDIYNRTKKSKVLFGIELEYIIYDSKTQQPVGWELSSGRDQGPFYCGVGGDNVFARKIMVDHMNACMKIGLHVRGINVEVAQGCQFEYQLGELDALSLSDEFWMSKYLLERICEKSGFYPVFHPKPLIPYELYNGSGCHCNVSTKITRELKGKQLEEEMEKICKKLESKHSEHLAVYGNPENNKMRLTGNHETGSFDKFVYGYNNRGASVRLQKDKSYFEDRRVPSDADMYVVTSRILETICSD